MDGLITRILDPTDASTAALRDEAVLHLVPMINPDGIAPANRAATPSASTSTAPGPTRRRDSPEVACVRDRMVETGVDLFLDIHGDERYPYCFLGGRLEIPTATPRLSNLFFRFAKSLGRRQPRLRTRTALSRRCPEAGRPSLRWNHVAEPFDCLSVTLEKPFKDNDASKIEGVGWTPERSVALGRSVLDPLAAVLKDLRETRA